MANEGINIDFKAAFDAVNKALPAETTDSSGNYSDEWMTTVCIGTLFTDVSSTMTTLEQTVNAMRTYLNRLNELAGFPQPELPTSREQEEGFEFGNYDGDNNVNRIIVRLGYTDLPEYKAVTKNVNVRPTPGTDGSPIDTLPSGTEVTVVETGLGENQAWNLVSYTGQDGLTHFGYVSSTSSGSEILTPKEGGTVTKEQVAAQQQFVKDNQSRVPHMADSAPRFAVGTGEAIYQPGARVSIKTNDNPDNGALHRTGVYGNNVEAVLPDGTEVEVIGNPYICNHGWTMITVKIDKTVTCDDGTTVPPGEYIIDADTIVGLVGDDN